MPPGQHGALPGSGLILGYEDRSDALVILRTQIISSYVLQGQ